MKNFKPMTAAPKGALCHCKDRLGPHFLSLAEGGSVPELSDEEYLERLARLRPSSGRRPERLNKSRDVNVPAQVARGWVAGTLGLPGDIEGLGRLLLQPSGKTLPGPLGEAQKAILPYLPDKESALPTSDFYREWLPGYDEAPAGRAASGLGSLAGGAGAGAVARGIRKGSGVVARGALGSVQAAMEGQGPLRGVLAPAAPMYAVKPRGGNVSDTAVDSLLQQMGHRKSDTTQAWLKKNMRNYLKRDFGAPTDPLLALEKELPGLHLSEDALPTQREIDALYTARDKAGMPRPQGFGVRPDEAFQDNAKLYLDKHDALSGGAPLTRWGRAADSNVLNYKAGEELASELGEKWPISAMYPGTTGGLDELLRHTDEMIGRFAERPDSLASKPNNTRLEKLQKYRDMLAEKMATDWRAKQPDADVYQPLQAASGDLGFDHMTDYIEAATEPYRKLKQNFGSAGWIPEGSPPEEIAQLEAAGAVEYKKAADALNKFAGTPEEFHSTFMEGMHPYSRDEIRRWFGLRDAGLLVDPESLPRMGVADVSRKTAAWNEFLANQGPTNEALAQGWRPFKEYGPEQGGMKWVEFGRGELPSGWSEKPDALGIVNLYDDAGEYVTQAGTHKDPRVSALRSGLGAEGDAMGHCVGGYCDDVLNRGTRIYSLRDAKGNPHVTIEVRPNNNRDWGAEQHRWATENPEEYAALKAKFPDLADQDREYRRMFRDKYAVPDEIVQIKGKGNAAPVDKYLSMVQDFVRSGKWGRVGDLGNTGLYDVGRLTRDAAEQKLSFGPFEGVTIADVNRWRDANPDKMFLSAEDMSEFLGRPIKATPRRGYANGGSVRPDEEAPQGFLPRSFEEWVEYAERLAAPAARKN